MNNPLDHIKDLEFNIEKLNMENIKVVPFMVTEMREKTLQMFCQKAYLKSRKQSHIKWIF